jgi:hypothetical protein
MNCLFNQLTHVISKRSFKSIHNNIKIKELITKANSYLKGIEIKDLINFNTLFL